MADDKNRGFYAKYSVHRADGKRVGQCLVLEFKDPNAWPAIEVWANSVDADGYQELAQDVRATLREFHEPLDIPRDEMLDRLSMLCARPIKAFGDLTPMEIEATLRGAWRA